MKNLYFSVIVTKSWDNYDGMLAVLDESHNVKSLPGGSAPEYENNLLTLPFQIKKHFLTHMTFVLMRIKIYTFLSLFK